MTSPLPVNHPNADNVVQVTTAPDDLIGDLMRRARAALDELDALVQAEESDADKQALLDEATTALAWSLYKPEHARFLARLAVETIGIGDIESKVIKNQRKTFGTLRDLLRVKTTGIIEEEPEKGLVKYGKPVGVVAAVTPSTNPCATPVNKAMMALKGGNAVIVSPSPGAWPVTSATVAAMRAELGRAGYPEDLVQVLPQPINFEVTATLMREADLVVCTGDQINVRAAYSSGTPAIGVGRGNVPVIVDETADLDAAAEKIAKSKCFDSGTSCSSENAVVIVDSVYDQAMAALVAQGAYHCDAKERKRVIARLWRDGQLNRSVIARGADHLAEAFGLPEAARQARFFLVEETGVGPNHPLSGEKLSLVLTVYRAKDFEEAKSIVADILEYQGKGHSCGIHSSDPARAREVAAELPVVRVLENQPHTFANGGGFDSGLPFTLSMGCGTWGGNSISENLTYKHFINITHLVTKIPEDKPSEEALFGAYWEKHGR